MARGTIGVDWTFYSSRSFPVLDEGIWGCGGRAGGRGGVGPGAGGAGVAGGEGGRGADGGGVKWMFA